MHSLGGGKRGAALRPCSPRGWGQGGARRSETCTSDRIGVRGQRAPSVCHGTSRTSGPHVQEAPWLMPGQTYLNSLPSNQTLILSRCKIRVTRYVTKRSPNQGERQTVPITERGHPSQDLSQPCREIYRVTLNPLLSESVTAGRGLSISSKLGFKSSCPKHR